MFEQAHLKICELMNELTHRKYQLLSFLVTKDLVVSSNIPWKMDFKDSYKDTLSIQSSIEKFDFKLILKNPQLK